MSSRSLELPPSAALSLLSRYKDVLAAHPGYFTDPHYSDENADSADRLSTGFFAGLLQPPVDPEAIRYLVDDVGLSRREVRLAKWASCSGPGGDRVLVAPAMDAGNVLAVRAVTVRSPLNVLSDLRPVSAFTLDPSERLIESDPAAALEVDDVPVPFRRGLFDESEVWVSYDPVDALYLRSVGLNATSLADPFGTLGSKEGLWHLQDLEVFTPRDAPEGLLVIVDPDRRPTAEQESLLKGQFREVWMPGKGSTGAYYMRYVSKAHKQSFFGKGPVRALVDIMAHDGHAPLQAEPVRLPERWTGPAGPPQPFTFVPVSELAKDTRPGPEWLVEGFLAPGTITQFLGGSKAGKSTLLLSMLAEVSRGGTFLGKKCRQAPVLYVTEQGRKSFVESLERSLPAGTRAVDLTDLLALTAEKVYGRSWAQVLGLVRKTVKQVGAQVVVFDTLSEAADVQGDAENSAGASRMLYRSLRGLLSDDMTIVAVRHTRKDERGGIAESGIGSVANSGAADHLVRVREIEKDSTVRRIDTKGRISDYEDFLLDLKPDGWIRLEKKKKDSTLKGTTRAERVRAMVADVLKEAGKAGLRRAELMARLRKKAAGANEPAPGKPAVDAALAALVTDEEVIEETLPRPGSPLLFRFVF
ncbi:MAG TPA: AAA family ATPase [Rubricoccaceae bacterium]|jgi:hypothetical protein